MSLEDYHQQIVEIFEHAIEGRPGLRKEILNDKCKGLPDDVRIELERLLEIYDTESSGGFLEPGTFNVRALLTSQRNTTNGRPDDTESFVLSETRRSAWPQAELPERLGRYSVERLLGRGGFGVVYLGYDERLERSVALKVAHGVADASVAKRFLREARILAKLEHPHILPVYDAEILDDGRCMIVAKWINGDSLKAVHGRRPLSYKESAELISNVALGLHAAHAQHVVHRDVKPTNILLDTARKPFVADFGLALRTQDAGVDVVNGLTPAYASPEQARGENPVDGRSDIFSLGVVFYELLTGRRPFEGTHPHQILNRIRNDEICPPRKIASDIPRALERICLRATRKCPSQRYDTAHDMADDLRRFLSSAPFAATPLSTFQPDVLFDSPKLPAHLIVRSKELSEIRDWLVAESPEPNFRGTRAIGIFGMAGMGKTVLAAQLADDDTIKQRYVDGVIWLTLGQQPDLAQIEMNLVAKLGGQDTFIDATASKEMLAGRLRTARCLVVLDDVWSAGDVRAFDMIGSRSSLLVTTRDASILTAIGARQYELEALSTPQAMTLLQEWSGQEHVAGDSDVLQVRNQCGNLPLALSICGALARDGIPWKDVAAALAESDLTFLEGTEVSEREIYRSLDLSVKNLGPHDQDRYLELGVFPSGEPIPEAAVTTLWSHTGEHSAREARKLLAIFDRKSLLRRDRVASTFTFHDLQHGYLETTNRDQCQARHRDLLNAYRRQGNVKVWSMMPNDGYLFEHLAYHLEKAGWKNELKQLVLQYDWLRAKLISSGVHSLLSDFRFCDEDNSCRLVRDALQLSAHLLACSSAHLKSQLYGRTLAVAPQVAKRLSESEEVDEAWVQCRQPSLASPGGGLIRTLEGHSMEVVALCMTDQRSVVSCSSDGSLKIWDLDTFVQLQELVGHSASVVAVRLLDSQTIVSASEDQTLKSWNLESGELIREVEASSDAITSLDADALGRAVIGSRDGTIRAWNMFTGERLMDRQGHSGAVRGLAITSDGKVVSGSNDATLKIWDLPTGSMIRSLRGHKFAIKFVVNVDDRKAISASEDGTIMVWNLDTGERLAFAGRHSRSVSALALTRDRKLVTGSHDMSIRVWDLTTGSELRRMQGHRDRITSLAVTDDGKVVSASRDQTLNVWDLDSGQRLLQLPGHNGSVKSVIVTEDGRAVSGSRDSTIKVWDLGHVMRPPAYVGHQQTVTALACTNDGKVISASNDWSLKIWSWDGTPSHHLTGHRRPVYAVAVTPSGQLVSAGADTSVKIWDLKSGICLHDLEGHTGSVRAIVVANNGEVISASDDKTLKVWNVESGGPRLTLRGHASSIVDVKVTAGGEVISASDDRNVKVWNLGSGKLLRDLTGHTDAVTAIAVAQNGTVVSASRDGTLRVWDLRSGASKFELKGHCEGVRAVAIAGDARIVSGSNDGAVKVWDLKSGELLHDFSGHKNAVTDVAIDGNDLAVSASTDHTLNIWDLIEGRLIAPFGADHPLNCCVLTSDGQMVAGDQSGRVHFLRLHSRRVQQNSDARRP